MDQVKFPELLKTIALNRYLLEGLRFEVKRSHYDIFLLLEFFLWDRAMNTSDRMDLMQMQNRFEPVLGVWIDLYLRKK